MYVQVITATLMNSSAVAGVFIIRKFVTDIMIVAFLIATKKVVVKIYILPRLYIYQCVIS